MRLLLSWIASSALVLILPIYISYIYDRSKSVGWGKLVKHIICALLIASGVFLLGWYGLTPTTAASAKPVPKLEFLNKRNLEEEMDLRKQKNLLDTQGLDRGLQIIKVKFDEAEYALEKNDSERALKLYEEIERGSDENGSFITFPSACIMNNKAIAYFRKQSDKGFRASSLFLSALHLEPKPPRELDLIQRNIDSLDRYLNQ